jgi:hypothetical protein
MLAIFALINCIGVSTEGDKGYYYYIYFKYQFVVPIILIRLLSLKSTLKSTGVNLTKVEPQ